MEKPIYGISPQSKAGPDRSLSDILSTKMNRRSFLTFSVLGGVLMASGEKIQNDSKDDLSSLEKDRLNSFPQSPSQEIFDLRRDQIKSSIRSEESQLKIGEKVELAGAAVLTATLGKAIYDLRRDYSKDKPSITSLPEESPLPDQTS